MSFSSLCAGVGRAALVLGLLTGCRTAPTAFLFRPGAYAGQSVDAYRRAAPPDSLSLAPASQPIAITSAPDQPAHRNRALGRHRAHRAVVPLAGRAASGGLPVARADNSAPRAARPAAPASHAADGIGKALIVVVIGGVLLVGLLAVLLATLTPAGFGAALLALAVGVPGLLLAKSGVSGLLRRRRKQRAPDGSFTGQKEPRERGTIRRALVSLLIGVAGLGAAVALVGHLAFGVSVLYAAAGLLALLIVFNLFWAVVGLIWRIRDHSRKQ